MQGDQACQLVLPLGELERKLWWLLKERPFTLFKKIKDEMDCG